MYIEEDRIRDLLIVRSRFTPREWEVVNREIGELQEEKVRRETFKTELSRRDLKLLNKRLRRYLGSLGGVMNVANDTDISSYFVQC